MMQLPRTTRRIAVSLAACAGIIASSAVAHADSLWQSVKTAGVLRCGAAVAPPYVVRDPQTGAYSGFFSKVCEDFGKQVLHVKVEFVPTTWANIVAGLQAGKWDMSMALNDTPEREKAVAFSAPVTPYNVSLVYNKNNPKIPKNIKSLADIDKSDIRIAVMSGTAQDKAITAALPHAQIVRLPGNDETRLALMSRRADMIADANITNMLLTEANPSWAVAYHPQPPLAQQEVDFGLPKNISQADLKVLNDFIAQETKNGDIAAEIKKSVQEMLAVSK